jgi:2-keto-4-pentenoate hydratase
MHITKAKSWREPPPADIDIDVVDAYAIQLINIRQRVAEGARAVGHRVGLSSLAMRIFDSAIPAHAVAAHP